MQKKLNRKAKASGRLLKEKKGLTLVELVIAVAILGIMVSPVLHAFTTSQTIDNKARRMSEATDAAHNIREVIDSVSVENFINTDDSKDLLGYDSKTEAAEDGTGYISTVIKGMKAGKSTYDAKVVFGTKSIDEVGRGEVDIFDYINQMEIVDYSDPDGTFAQPYLESANPDNIAETYFFMNTGSEVFHDKQRTVGIEITSETDAEGTKKIFVNVTYTYRFRYSKQITDSSGIGTGNYDHNVWYEKSIVYSAIPGGTELHADGTPLTCYIMYYPFYNLPNWDTINIYNYDDIPMKILLVKQWPMDESGNELDNNELFNKEIAYQCAINEYHSRRYKVSEERMLYTNAMINIAADDAVSNELSNITYRIFRGNSSTYEQLTRLIKNGEVITTTKKDRFYDVAIYLYEEGKSESGEPIAKFRATKAE